MHGASVYRTDKNGEISININRNISVNKFIKD